MKNIILLYSMIGTILLFSSCTEEVITPEPVMESIDIAAANLTAKNTDLTDVTYLGAAATKVNVTPARQQAVDDSMAVGTMIGPEAYATLPVEMYTGIVEFDMAIQLNQYANPFSRGFAGLAYRLQDDGVTYEGIYARGTNGLLNDPFPSATQVIHGLQYFSEPNYHFLALRASHPEVYEKPASIAIDTWHHYKYVIGESTTAIYIDNAPAPSMTVDNQFSVTNSGKVALWIGTSTDAYFKDLTVTVIK
ncbi:MAG: Unknown protein [uncultured Aureispira sp.]|uniref:3-keto-disaccharide hydrolase domain-containing protein n=1 Tax=uncultured Aureispira sp. TaxID=1331704 RepID=A0A6S6S6L4_9BACT|nr:MAG: Unknown protein [uncultured Aureispira sp.]